MEPGGKHFKKRSAIYEYLCDTRAHPSAETVFTQLKPQIPDLSMGTVYRNLKLFCQQGKASVIATVDGVERFDANTQPHVHFICTHCNAVADLMELEIPQSLVSQAAAQCGGTIEGCQLSFTGICPQCNIMKESGETA